jgi:hypothetical protein
MQCRRSSGEEEAQDSRDFSQHIPKPNHKLEIKNNKQNGPDSVPLLEMKLGHREREIERVCVCVFL